VEISKLRPLTTIAAALDRVLSLCPAKDDGDGIVLRTEKRPMKSMRKAHIVVVGDGDHGVKLAARLRRMAVAQVTTVAGLAEARGICRNGGAHACIVVCDEILPDQVPPPAADAPGRGNGVPSLVIVPAVTSLARKAARRDGYLAALPANIAPRMLYRRIGAALQHRRAARRARRPQPTVFGVSALAPRLPVLMEKPTLH
jgi:hypothetical protein